MTRQAAKKKRAAAQEPKPDAARIVDLNFKVPFTFKKRVRLFAVEHDMTVVDVFRLAFERLERDGV